MKQKKKKIFVKEERCLNCEAPLQGKFCASCGQKAYLHKDSFWHMVTHFASDYLHYDNKFWNTLKEMFTNPGNITLEYNFGKRAKYLNPIQFYIFVTTLFFLFLFANKKSSINTNDKKSILAVADSLSRDFKQDSLLKPKSNSGFRLIKDSTSGVSRLDLTGLVSQAEYDSTQASLPANKRDGYIVKNLTKQAIKLYEVEKKGGDVQIAFKNSFRSNVPKIFFLLLPLFALFLKVFYYRNKVLYVDHIIFSIHFHSLLFIFLAIKRILEKIITNQGFHNVLSLLTIIGIFIYLILALKKVYGGSILKTIFKVILLSLAYGICFAIVGAVIAFISFYFL